MNNHPQNSPHTNPHRHPARTRGLLRKCMAALVLAVAGTGLTGCFSTSQDATRSPNAEAPTNTFATKWSADLKIEGDQVEHIYLREEFVILYTHKHAAYVLDKDQGVIRFSAKVTSELTTLRPPVVQKDWIVFPTTTVMQIYNRQGKKLREESTGGVPLRTNVIGAGTRLYFGGDANGHGRLVNEDLAGSQYQTAAVRWELLTRGGLSGAPAFHQGLVYAGDERGGVYAVNAESRAPVWALKEEGMEENVFKTRGPIKADIKADDFGVYVPSTDTKLYCIERTSGKIRWQYFAGVPLYYSPAVTASTVYLNTDEQGLVAIDKTAGEYNRRPKWTAPDAIRFLSEDEKHAYLEKKDHTIMAVDRASGEVKFASKRTDFVSYTANFSKDPKVSNIIYATTADGQVRAIVPVLKPGLHGELVMTLDPAPAVAMAR